MRQRYAHTIITRRQRICAWAMLLVYVPMVLLASLHVHDLHELSQQVECSLCETSSHHQGHITAAPQHHGECLSCRFLNTQLDVPDGQVWDFVYQCVSKLEIAQVVEPVVQILVRPALRAPPVIL